MITKIVLFMSLFAMAAFAASPIPTQTAVEMAVICFPPPPSCYGCHSNPPYPCQDELKAVQKNLVHAANAVPPPTVNPATTPASPLTRKQIDSAIAMVLGGGKTGLSCFCIDTGPGDGTYCCRSGNDTVCSPGFPGCGAAAGKKGPVDSSSPLPVIATLHDRQ